MDRNTLVSRVSVLPQTMLYKYAQFVKFLTVYAYTSCMINDYFSNILYDIWKIWLNLPLRNLRCLSYIISKLAVYISTVRIKQTMAFKRYVLIDQVNKLIVLFYIFCTIYYIFWLYITINYLYSFRSELSVQRNRHLSQFDMFTEEGMFNFCNNFNSYSTESPRKSGIMVLLRFFSMNKKKYFSSVFTKNSTSFLLWFVLIMITLKLVG